MAAIRSRFPALADGYAYLDGAAGTQVPRSVVDAIADAYRAGLGNAGGAFPACARAERLVAEARRAVADLVGGRPEGVVFGGSATALTYRFAATLAATWRPGDEVVLSRLDHDANVRPWVQVAGRAGAVVRFAEVDPSGELPAEQYDELVTERTRLVAVTAASNVIGTRPDVAAITAKARAVGALSYVDGVHATPHGPVDVAELGADFYATSAYKWCGPHLAAVVADPAALSPSPDPFAGRRANVLSSMAAAEAHERELFAALHDRLAEFPRVTTYGKAVRRTATAYFTVDGHTPRAVAEHLARAGVNAWNGHNYAWELTGALGIRDTGSAVRVGLVHYNDRSDVDKFLNAVADVAS